MAKKSLEQYMREEREKALKEYHAAADQLTADTEREIEAAKQAIDREAAKDTADLQHEQTLVRQDSRPLYDAAAVQELVDRQNIEERMASLGLSKSGTKDAGLAGAAQRKRVTEQNVKKAVDRTVSELDRDISAVRTQAAQDKTDVKQKLNKKLQEKTYELMQDYLDQANKDAQEKYDTATGKELEESINKQLASKTGGMYIYENGKIKKVGDDSLFGALDKELRYQSGGMFGISDTGTIQVLSNVNEGLIKFLDAELRKVSKGKYGVTGDGFVLVLEADD